MPKSQNEESPFWQHAWLWGAVRGFLLRSFLHAAVSQAVVVSGQFSGRRGGLVHSMPFETVNEQCPDVQNCGHCSQCCLELGNDRRCRCESKISWLLQNAQSAVNEKHGCFEVCQAAESLSV